jgi:hypothetical protein
LHPAIVVVGMAGPVSAAPSPNERANPTVGCENVLSRNLNADFSTARNAERAGANFLAVGIALGCVEPTVPGPVI